LGCSATRRRTTPCIGYSQPSDTACLGIPSFPVVPVELVDWLIDWLVGFKDLCPGVPQNSVRKAKCPGFFWVLKTRYFWPIVRTYWLSDAGRKHVQRRTAISRPLAGRNRRGRGRCVDWWLQSLDRDCEGWGTDM
jgi:hypothetical protein